MERGEAEGGRAVDDVSRILIADDTELFLHATADLLRREGYACDCARDAAEASLMLRRGEYDLLLADIKMPGNEDLELLRDVRDLPVPLPVILVTGYPSVPTAVEALRLAVVDYLIKPLDVGELCDRVARAIEKGQALRSARHLREITRDWFETLGRFQEALSLPGPRPRGVVAVPEAAAEDHRGVEALAGAGAALLSPREHEIVRALARGERVAHMARSLSISTHTVRNHLKSIYRKLGVHSQVELLVQVREHAPST